MAFLQDKGPARANCAEQQAVSKSSTPSINSLRLMCLLSHLGGKLEDEFAGLLL